MTVAEQVWLGELVEVVAAGDQFTGLRGRIVKVLKGLPDTTFTVEFPIGYDHVSAIYGLPEVAVV